MIQRLVVGWFCIVGMVVYTLVCGLYESGRWLKQGISQTKPHATSDELTTTTSGHTPHGPSAETSDQTRRTQTSRHSSHDDIENPSTRGSTRVVGRQRAHRLRHLRAPTKPAQSQQQPASISSRYSRRTTRTRVGSRRRRR